MGNEVLGGFKVKSLLLLTMVFGLMSCQIDVEVKRQANFEGIRKVHRGSIYSTYVNGKEHVGTQIKLYLDEDIVQEGNKTIIRRRFIDENSSGYHRKSLPWELVHMTPLTMEVRNDTMISIQGLEKFEEVVIPNLQTPKKYEDQLRAAKIEGPAGRFLRHEWFLTHLLVGEFKTKQDVTDKIRFKKFGNWTIDSVKTVRVEDIDDRDCLRYEVYFQEPLKYNYLMFEQMVAAYHPEIEPFKPFKWESAHGEGVQTVWTDLDTGRLCKTHLHQKQFNIAKHKETGEPLEFISNRFSEALYTYPEGDE